MKLQFIGATGTVTGSKLLVEHRRHRVLLDCGLFQGLKQLRLRNWAPLPVPASTIDAVVLTHAHLDHSGYVPRLVEEGFRGRVHCTAATEDLAGLLLPDSGHLMEEEAEYANRHGFAKHKPALPLYTEQSARDALQRFDRHGFEQPFEPAPGLQVRFHPAGHLLGAASVELRWGHGTDAGSLLLSGDLGRQHDLLMPPPDKPVAADTVIVESTYGDRTHPPGDPMTRVAEVVSRTAARGGIVLVPSFAVGRAQVLLHCMAVLKREQRIPNLPVYLNSPMAAEATRLLSRHPGAHRLDAAQCEALATVATIVDTVEASRRLNEMRFPAVIISASGMATGGRVVHHLKAFAPDPRNTILFTGYQAAGTRGASIVGGAPTVKIHGEHVPVRAEVANLDLLSAHADRDELLDWLGALPRPPRQVWVTHGEPSAADSLRQAIEERFGWPAAVPDYLQTVTP